MEVRFMSVTQGARGVIYASGRQCYSDKTAYELLSDGVDVFRQEAFIADLLASGHESPLEHVSYTFSVSDVSRALSHQLVRHRIASYSQQSQRYVDGDNLGFVIPASIACDEDLLERYIEVMNEIRFLYADMKHKGVPNEDARYVLSNATITNIVVTMNCRSLIHFFEQRMCTRAQWEIRRLAEKMHAICKTDLPSVFSTIGPKCKRLGYCPEAKSCGRMKSKAEVLGCQK